VGGKRKRKEREMAKMKSNTELQASIDREFPSVTLYTSPPEASSLKAWVRQVEEKRRVTAAQSDTRERDHTSKQPE
jgi:hypothetical protein